MKSMYKGPRTLARSKCSVGVAELFENVVSSILFKTCICGHVFSNY